MRIGYIHPNWPGDEGTGATYSATQIVEGLSERGHDLCVYCTADPPDEAYEKSNFALKLVADDWFPHTNTQLNRAVRRMINEFDQYDIVTSYLPSLVPVMEEISKKTSAATSVTLNAYAGVCPKNDLLYLDKENCLENTTAKCIECILRTSGGHEEYSTPYRIVSRMGNLRLIRQGRKRIDSIDGFRAPSTHVKANYTELGYPADKISVIPHPLNDAFLVEHKSDFKEPYRLLYVGFLESQKGVDKLIPILSGLQGEVNQTVTLTIIGKGGLRSKMERQAADFGVEAAVDFRGFVPNEQLPPIYADHDVFVYPGIWEEPLARVYLEALATGTPIVSSRYGSIESIVGDGGVLTDGSVEGFIRMIASLIREDDLPALAADGKRQVERYDREVVISKIEEMYASISQ